MFQQNEFIFNRGPVVIAGQIKNSVSGVVILTMLEVAGSTQHVTKLDNNGNFKFELETFSAHNNFITIGKGIETIYIEPFDSIYIEADATNVKESIKYSGDKVKFNECINLYRIAFGKNLEAEDFFVKRETLSPNAFKEFSTEFFKQMYSKIDAIIDQVKPESTKTKEWLYTQLKYRKASELVEYGMKYKNELDANYYDFLDEYLIPDKYSMESSKYYNGFIKTYYMTYELSKAEGFNEAVGKYKSRSYSGIAEMFGFLDKNISDKTIKYLAITKSLSSIIHSDYTLADSLFDEYAKYVKDPNYQNFILSQIESQKAAPIHASSLNDLVELDHLGDIFKELSKNNSNKVLYIDMWGTWCGGCIQALPYTDKLLEEFGNENFEVAYFCVNSKKEDWEKSHEKYNLNGANYLLTKEQSKKLSETFNFYSIPRYLLIDKNGKIVDANAKPPYSYALKEEIVKLINN